MKGPQLAVDFAREWQWRLARDLATLTRMVLGGVADPHKIHIFLEYHSVVCPIVRFGTLTQASMSPRTQRGGEHTRLRVGGGGVTTKRGWTKK